MSLMEQQPQKLEEVVLAKPPEPKIFYYILSFLVFPVGLFFGLIYLRKEGIENISFGTRSLIAGVVLPGILLFIGIVSLLLLA